MCASCCPFEDEDAKTRQTAESAQNDREMQAIQQQHVAASQATAEQSEIYQALESMTTELGLPAHKINEYIQVFETHEVYTLKALRMLPEDEIDTIASECGMKIPAKL